MKKVVTTITICSLIIIAGLFFSVRFASAATLNTSPSNSLKTGLVGWWTFDGSDVSANTTTDKSGYGNNGTRVGGTSLQGGKVGQAMKFNGSSGGINAGHAANLLITTGTVSAWIKTSGAGSSWRLILSRNSVGQGLYLLDNVLATYDNGGGNGTLTTGINLADNKWHFVAMSFNSGVTNGTKIYIDGVLKLTNTATVLNPGSTVNWSIGYNNIDNTYHLNGSIDDARVYNRALSASEIQQLYKLGGGKINKTPVNPLLNGLVGWWTMDGADTTVNTTTDKSGYGNNGARTGTKSVLGKIGQGLSFDRSSSIKINNSSSINNTTLLTVSGWYKPNGLLTTGREWTLASKNYTTWELNVIANTNNQLRTYLGDGVGGYDTYSWGIPLPQNVWSYVTLVVDGSKVKLYIDGVLRSQPAQAHPLPTSTQDVYVGSRGGNDLFWYGLIDDVRIYNRALSASEIQELFTQGGGKINKTPANPLLNGLVGWWTFDGMDTTAVTSTDKSGRGNNGTRMGGTKTVIGKIGQAMKFDGSSGYVNAGNGLGNFTSTSPFTVSLWVKMISGGQKSLVSRAGAGGVGWYLYYDDAGTVCTNCFFWDFYAGGYDRITTSNGSAARNKWYHVVILQDGTGALAGRKLYINGVSMGNGVRNGTVANPDYTGTTVQIGARGGASFSNAQTDDVRIYNRALSAQEIQMLYKMGK